MSKCWNCGKDNTLKEDETRCSVCNEIMRFWCHNCKEPFDVADKKQIKLHECKVCGYFQCPHCGICGPTCFKQDWRDELIKILPNTSSESIGKIIKLIESIKINIDKKLCPNNVPISYAKGNIKSCIARTEGYRTKNLIDKDKFKERLQKVIDIPIGNTLTVDQIREDGSYGKEWRDILNTSICYGWIKATWKTKKVGNKDVKYILFTRIEGKPCPHLDVKDIIVMKCPKCKKSFPLDKTFCDGCFYKKTTTKHNKGDAFELNLSLASKDICQLARNEFKKRRDKKEDGQNS